MYLGSCGLSKASGNWGRKISPLLIGRMWETGCIRDQYTIHVLSLQDVKVKYLSEVQLGKTYH